METAIQLNPSERHADPLTDAAGSHPVGTGIGAVTGGALAGAAVGTVAGPVGTVIGAALGAIAGGLAGKAVAEHVNPTTDFSVISAEPISSTKISHETIALHAYDLWERRGRLDGHAVDDWLDAEAFLRAQV